MDASKSYFAQTRNWQVGSQADLCNAHTTICTFPKKESTGENCLKMGCNTLTKLERVKEQNTDFPSTFGKLATFGEEK